MNTIQCTHCGKEIELSEALTKDIEKTVLEAEHKKHLAELEKVQKDTDEKTLKLMDAERLKAQTDASAKLEHKLKQMQEESDSDRLKVKETRKQLSVLMQELRDSKKTVANAELEMQKKLAEEEQKLRYQKMA